MAKSRKNTKKHSDAIAIGWTEMACALLSMVRASLDEELSFHAVNPFTATGYVDIPPPRWPTFLVTLFPILKEGMGLSLLDEFEVQYHVIKK